MRKKWLIVVTTLLIVMLILNTIIGFYFYRLAIERGPKDFLQGNADLEVSADTLEEFLEGDWIKWTENKNFTEMDLTAFDGTPLKGYYLATEEPSKKTVVFAHGYLGHAFNMGLFGQYYYEQLGYNVFTPDLRGHGKSGGEYIGFGWHDRLDLVDWVKLIVEKSGIDSEIVLHGLSMGAAAVLMASGEELPEQVKAIVADSPYTSAYDLFAYQMKRMYHLPAVPVLPTTSVVTKLKADYSLTEASALHQVANAKVPILFIHGEGDTFVPTEMTNALYDLVDGDKEKIIFPEANHGESIVLHREAYLETVTDFLEKYIAS